MKKEELIRTIAKRSGLQIKEAKKFLNAYHATVTEALANKETILATGFGHLYTVKEKERATRKIVTRESMVIPSRTTVRFKPGRLLLRAINKQED